MSGKSGLSANGEGWIEWSGGECTVSPDITVEVRTLHDTYIALAGNIAWDYPFRGYRVYDYRIHKESTH